MLQKWLKDLKNKFFKAIVLALSTVALVSCSIGTSFRVNDIRTFKGNLLIPELSSEPILIEKISTDLVKKENKKSLNLPLNLLNYSPDSYKVGAGDVLFIYVYGETERLSAALARGARLLTQFLKKLWRRWINFLSKCRDY